MANRDNRYRATVGLALRFAGELWWAAKTSFLRSPQAQQEKLRALYTSQAREFREFATEMGGLIIKLGQFLSVRIDFLPKEYIDELGKLQDAVPALPTKVMTQVIERELDAPLDELFTDFDQVPLAAASLGQVYRAKLPAGEDVAVKILRPGIEDLIDVDVRSLWTIMRGLDRFTAIGKYLDVSEFCRDFEATFRAELDYQGEGGNAERFQRNFLLSPAVEMPKIYWSHTTSRVLTMEFMDGVKINDLPALDALGVDRPLVARRLLEIYLQMFLSDGFFHADPHPGNVFVRPDGVIQLIDFGMVGSISDGQRKGFTELITAIFARDATGIVETLRDLGFLGRDADTRALKQVLTPLIDTVIGEAGSIFQGAFSFDKVMEGRQLASFQVDAATLDEMREVIRTQPISLPGNTTFLGKALITVFSNCYKLDPAVDVVAVTEPFIRELADTGFQGVISTLAADGGALLRALPVTLKRLVSLAEKLDSGEFELNLSAAQARRLERLGRVQTRQVVTAIVGSAGVLAGVLGYLLRPKR
ncbi:MAG: AarF/ABC1/UbiB kinase family protein [Propionibacteriaceae bacterium]|jgi:predicted unusual protein kinase regulating ubiquinone biosynthesis (AarF/ABC1/UbiB family)|nr:AarF/ABC1/UbiB kinase family protein [Propionibacteriaceae bacterium]